MDKNSDGDKDWIDQLSKLTKEVFLPFLVLALCFYFVKQQPQISIFANLGISTLIAVIARCVLLQK